MRPTACALGLDALDDARAWARRHLREAPAEEAVFDRLVGAYLRARNVGDLFVEGRARFCRVCGCTDLNACLDADGRGCRWAANDLCSACAPYLAAAAASRPEGGQPMEKITGWEAKRAGAGLTIVGKDASGKQRRITGVDKIVRGSTGVVARNKDGGAVVELA